MNERINELRTYFGLTLDKFGERIGVKKAAVSRWEHGDKVADRMIISICREFNVNEEWLRNGTGDMFVMPNDDTAALVSNLLEETDDEFYQAILELVRTYEQLQPDSRKVLRNFGKMYLENMKNLKD